MQKQLLVVMVAFIFLAGCASLVNVKRYTPEHYPPALVLDVRASVPPYGSYYEIAELSIDSRIEDAVLQLSSKAKELGAEAIILKGERTPKRIRFEERAKDVTRLNPEVWAIAIRYEERGLSRQPLTTSEAAIKADRQIQGVELKEPQRLSEPARPARTKPYYAVVELEKMYLAETWAASANFSVLTKKSNEAACIAALKNRSTDQRSAECVEESSWYDQIFNHQPTGDWYVTVQIEDRYYGATVVHFGEKRTRSGKKIEWEESDQLEIARSVAQGMSLEAKAKSVDAIVRIFSPTQEVQF